MEASVEDTAPDIRWNVWKCGGSIPWVAGSKLGSWPRHTRTACINVEFFSTWREAMDHVREEVSENPHGILADI